jgi:hypothetical protein
MHPEKDSETADDFAHEYRIEVEKLGKRLAEAGSRARRPAIRISKIKMGEKGERDQEDRPYR